MVSAIKFWFKVDDCCTIMSYDGMLDNGSGHLSSSIELILSIWQHRVLKIDIVEENYA